MQPKRQVVSTESGFSTPFNFGSSRRKSNAGSVTDQQTVPSLSTSDHVSRAPPCSQLTPTFTHVDATFTGSPTFTFSGYETERSSKR